MRNQLLEKLPFSPIKEIDWSIFPWLELDYVEVEKGVSLRVFKIPKKKKQSKINIVVIPGLSSHFLGWIDLNHELSQIGDVYHIESREKSSAKYSKRKIDYSMETLARDINNVVETYKLDKDGFYLFGDSFGSEMAAQSLKLGFHTPKGLVLISPTRTFAFSGWMKILFSIAPFWLYYPLLPFLKFVLKRFRTDMKNDAGTYYLNSRNIVTGNPKRMKWCAMSLFRYSSSLDYSIITYPTYIIAASTDKMHSYQESVEIAAEIPNAIFEDVVYYHITHGRKVAKKVQDFILGLENKK